MKSFPGFTAYTTGRKVAISCVYFVEGDKFTQSRDNTLAEHFILMLIFLIRNTQAHMTVTKSAIVLRRRYAFRAPRTNVRLVAGFGAFKV